MNARLIAAALLFAGVLVLAALVLACAVYGWFEAGWLRRRVLEVPIDGLPEALDGLRIGHLSDFHLGAPLSRGNGAVHQRRVLESTGELTAVVDHLRERTEASGS